MGDLLNVGCRDPNQFRKPAGIQPGRLEGGAHRVAAVTAVVALKARGMMTGHNAVAYRANQLGLSFGQADLRAVTAEIKRRADEHPLTNEELDLLLREWVTA